MVFLISYRKKFDGTRLQSKLRRTFFAQHRNDPSFEEIQSLVDFVSQGDFAESSIEFQKCMGFDADELKKCGVTVYHFQTVRLE